MIYLDVSNMTEEQILNKYSKFIRKIDNNNFYFLGNDNTLKKYLKTGASALTYSVPGKLIHVDTRGSITIRAIKTDDPFQEALNLFRLTLDLDEEVFFEPLMKEAVW